MSNQNITWAYVVVRKDYDHHEDDAKIDTVICSVHLTLRAANRAAKEEADEQAELSLSGDSEVEVSKNKFGGYVGYCQTFQDERDHFEIEVERYPVFDAIEALSGKGAVDIDDGEDDDEDGDDDEDEEDTAPPSKKRQRV